MDDVEALLSVKDSVERATRTFHSEEQKFGNELRALQKILAMNACSVRHAAAALHSEQRASQHCHAKKIWQQQPQAKKFEFRGVSNTAPPDSATQD